MTAVIIVSIIIAITAVIAAIITVINIAITTVIAVIITVMTRVSAAPVIAVIIIAVIWPILRASARYILTLDFCTAGRTFLYSVCQ